MCLELMLGSEWCQDPSVSSYGSLGSDLAPSGISETMLMPEYAGSASP